MYSLVSRSGVRVQYGVLSNKMEGFDGSSSA